MWPTPIWKKIQNIATFIRDEKLTFGLSLICKLLLVESSDNLVPNISQMQKDSVHRVYLLDPLSNMT